MESDIDFLVLGSGLSALSFAALMANEGKRVRVLEAHYHPGGYGHTFEEAKAYRFNAQLHYVWNCGEGRTVNNFLRKLGLHEEVTFGEFDANGFDRMRMPGYALDIPYDRQVLIARLQELFPSHKEVLQKFIEEVERTSIELDSLPKPASALRMLTHLHRIKRVMRYRNSTLQDVFDRFELPKEAQTLLALQWPDFLLPPDQLSFFAWVMLFMGYCNGAYYPHKHFDHFVNALVATIEENGGEVLYNQRVMEFIVDGNRVSGVVAENVEDPSERREFFGKDIICNIDPKKAASMIGIDRFSPKVRRQLDYDYSPSNFMAYCVVKGIDLRDYGFGRSNLFHTEEPDLNVAFHKMYDCGDYSKLSFAMTVPTLLSEHRSDCPEDCQIVEFLTVANYQRFLELKIADARDYRKKKNEILDAIIDIVQRDYVPGFRDHLVFKMTGSPTTNERYCWSPAGNSYGSNMTPKNIGPGRLSYHSSLKNFYFCNASSGFAGFTGTIWTGCRLYEALGGSSVLLSHQAAATVQARANEAK
jgi:phytoene dehydrogenase-like protein